MRRSLTALFALTVLLSGTTQAQAPRKTQRVAPITTTVRDAGTYHLATGQWTRGVSQAAMAGPDVIYDNTCTVGLYMTLSEGDVALDSGRVPSPTSPSSGTSLTGIYDDYNVNGFRFAYCTPEAPAACNVSFTDCYAVCDNAGLPAPMVSFNLTNIPGGPGGGALGCWTFNVDLANTTFEFSLGADCDGVYDNSPSLDSFAWTWTQTIPTTGALAGPIIAGDPFGFYSSSCGGFGAGTTFPGASPGNGTGIGILDSVQLGAGPTNPGCYWFGGYSAINPLASFYLQLFSDGPRFPTDCNNNGIPDDQELQGNDCNFNGIPDDCELPGNDCNMNGLLDACEIYFGLEQDCNFNGKPDSCDIEDGTSEDCNGNSVPDECDIAFGFSQDCNGNLIPDECDIAAGTEEDCNGNGIPDSCDLATGTSKDCNDNLLPDECDIALGFEEDCNGNGIPDSCDIDTGTSKDCNNNLIPDECDIATGLEKDCNGNGIPDSCDLATGASKDCNNNLIPDECDIATGLEKDCNDNEIPDSCDLATGASKDCNNNLIPDECDIATGLEKDCNGNGVPDACDIEAETSKDCNFNEIPDECDIAAGTAEDCNGNGIPDLCDISTGDSIDCNNNDVPDECDIAMGTSEDLNQNEIPDECDEECVQVGALTVCADQVTEGTQGVYTASGNVRIQVGETIFLRITSNVTVDTNVALISGSGSVIVPAEIIPQLGEFTLYSGSFDFDVAANTMATANDLLSKWAPAGLKLEITELQLMGSTVTVAGHLELPDLLDGIEADVRAHLSPAGIVFESFSGSGCFTIPEAFLKGSPWKIKQGCVSYEWAAGGLDKFTAEFTTEFRDLETEGGFELLGGDIDRLWVQSELPFQWGPPNPYMGTLHTFAVPNMGGDISNLTQTGAYILKGNTTLVFGPDSIYLLGSDVIGADLSFSYSALSDEFAAKGLGTLFIPPQPVTLPYFEVTYDGYEIAGLELEYSPAEGFWMGGWLNLVGGAIQGQTWLSVGPGNHFSGLGIYQFRVPDALPDWMGAGQTIYGTRANFSQAGITTCFEITVIEVCATISATGAVTFASNWDEVFGLQMPVGAGFTNPTAGNDFLVLADWTAGSSSFLLTAPDSTVYDSRSMPANDPVTFHTSADGLHAWFHIENAAAGLWSIDSVDDTSTGLAYRGLFANQPPTITVTEAAPVVQGIVGSPLSVPYEAFDGDDQATITFALMENPEGTRVIGLPTAAPILESDGPGLAQLDLPADLSPGSYWLVAQVDDGRNMPRTDLALTRYEITNPALPIAPVRVHVAPQLDHVMVAYSPAASGPAASGFQIELREAYGTNAEPVVRTVPPSQQVVRIMAPRFQPGAEYWVRVTPIGPGQAFGESSEPVLVRAPLANSGAGPVLRKVPESTAPAATPWTTELVVSEVGTGPVTLNILPNPDIPTASLPLGLSWNEVTPGIWDLQLDGSSAPGVYPLRIETGDGDGNTAEVDWFLTVNDNLAHNLPPEITSRPEPRVDPGDPWSYGVLASDPNPGDGISLELVEGPGEVTLNGTTLSLDAGSSLTGVQRITLVARDGSGLETLQTFFLSITEEPTGPRHSIGDAGGQNEW